MPEDKQPDYQKLGDFYQALVAAYDKRIDLEIMLLYRTGHKYSHCAAESLTLPEAIHKIIEKALNESWFDVFAEAVYRAKPHNPGIVKYIAEEFPHLIPASEIKSGAPGDPLNACFLSDNQKMLFMDRQELRNGLRDMTAEGLTSRILSVHSDLNRCGKTYTYEFIRFLALQRKDKVAYIDLREEIDKGHDMLDIAKLLARRLSMNEGDIPDREAQKENWLNRLVEKIMEHMRDSKCFWWLVFDGINQVSKLPQDIEAFIQHLARVIVIEFDPPCRLILISYDANKALSYDLHKYIVHDEIKDPLGEKQLRSFFTAQVRGRAGEAVPEAKLAAVVDTLVGAVMSKLANEPKEKQPYAISSLVCQALVHLPDLHGEVEAHG